ncbi:hypothetical protein GOV06_03030 [Candidatus Woesearchaeota archaeon]|nr:hypothetical protein [Candidatus Woesearchaeota archaeon]
MINPKKYLAIAIITTLILITGCGEEEAVTGPSPYIGGIKGLVAEFEPLGIEESGIYTVFEDESFPIQIILKNKGEHDLAPGDSSITIHGIPLADFTGISSGTLSNTEEIEKISELNEEGGEKIIDFGQNVKYNQVIPGTFYDVNIFASYTYAYKTYASIPNVCFKENLRDDRVCEVDESKKVYSSGAPIQVESVAEKPAGAGLISLEFKIENVGGGRATIPGKDFSSQYNQLAYTIEPVTERGKWTCTAAGRENEARLINDKATIRCRLKDPLEKDALYTKAIGLTLSYDYRDLIQETVRIKRTI